MLFHGCGTYGCMGWEVKVDRAIGSMPKGNELGQHIFELGYIVYTKASNIFFYTRPSLYMVMKSPPHECTSLAA